MVRNGEDQACECCEVDVHVGRWGWRELIRVLTRPLADGFAPFG